MKKLEVITSKPHLAEAMKQAVEDIPYSVAQGEKYFDWNDFLERAIKGEIKVYERFDTVELAGCWVTCACGNMCSEISRDDDGRPNDDSLNELGRIFHRQIRKRYYEEARETLHEIEARSAFLLKKLKLKELKA